mmetsp:Transcript_30842/g.69257  ORF Transcript_30842/g.69257 Transcript_30842/m.69257 type:complete len:265 (+) Transcript_30842:159-953(+)
MKKKGDTVVLFVPGLESGPRGSKAKYLSKHFPNTVALDLRMGLGLQHENGPVRWLGLYLVAAAAVCATALHMFGTWPARAAPLLLGAAGLVPFMRWRVQCSLEACTDVVAAAVREAAPDVLVGSSWGGRVVLRVIERREWAGPTVLLCPAVAASPPLFRAVLPPYLPSVPPAAASACRVLHGSADDVVPMGAVADLCLNCGMPLEVLPGADHRLNDGLLKTHHLRAVIKGAIAPAEFRNSLLVGSTATGGVGCDSDLKERSPLL